MKSRIKTIFSAGLILITQAVYAEAPETYVGVGYGQFKFEFDNDDIDTDFEDSQEVLKLYLGGKINEVVGLEFSYLNFDEANDNDFNADIEGLSLAGIFSLPAGEYLSFFGKAGWFSWEADIDGVTVGPVSIPVSSSIDGDDLFYGIGLKFGLGDSLDLRFDYDRYELDDDIDPELDIISVNVQYVF